MFTPCELLELPTRPTLAARTTLAVQNLPQFLGAAYPGIMGALKTLGVEPAGMPFVTYYNMDMQALEIEVGFPVAKPVPATAGYQPGELAAGRYASTIYTGPYADCGPAYEALTKWVEEKGYTATGVAIEQYFDGPEVPPEKTRTQILFPLK